MNKPEKVTETASSNKGAPKKFVQALNNNLDTTSRTAKGVSDVSASDLKPKLSTDGESLKEKSRNNFDKMTELIWKEKYHAFSSSAELRQFIETIAAGISDGLLKPEQGLLRTWETKLSHQTKPENIERDFEIFINDLFQQLHSPHADGLKIAAFAEQRLDSRVHPFADGCGRTSKIVSAWILARYHLPLPQWTSRDEYYEQIEKDLPTWQAYYKNHVENADSPRTIHTHQKADSDAFSSVAAYKRYAIPAGHETNVKFVPAGTKTNLEATDVFLDIDGGMKGRKETDGRTHSSFRQIMEVYAPPEEREALKYLIEYIDSIDTYGPAELLKKLDAETAKTISENTLRELLESLRYSNLKTDHDILTVFEEMFSGLLERGRLRIAASQEVARAEFPFGPTIAIVKEKKNPFTVDLLFEKGAQVVIYTDGNNIGVLRKDGAELNLKELLEVEIGSQESGWFFHDHGFMAARGTFKNPSTSKSKITPEIIAEILRKNIGD